MLEAIGVAPAELELPYHRQRNALAIGAPPNSIDLLRYRNGSTLIATNVRQAAKGLMPTKCYELKGNVVADGLRFPEGPIATSDGSLLVVEIAAGVLTRIGTNGHKSVVAELGGGPNGAAIGPDGYCYICNNGGLAWARHADGLLRPTGNAVEYPGGRIERVDLSTGSVERIYDRCDGNQLRAPNDLVFDETGGFWFTDLGMTHSRHLDRGSVLYARTGTSHIKEVIFPITTPNGIGLSRDRRDLYVAETETARLWRFAIGSDGNVIKKPWPSPNGGVVVHGLGGYARFDSLALEANGNICVGTLIRGGVSVISSEGELLEFWSSPDPYCTNICFGGPGLRTAYVTLSGYGQVLAVDWPRPGLPVAFASAKLNDDEAIGMPSQDIRPEL